MSCRNPGRVISSVRVPPPIVAAASKTRTEMPFRASSIAAASPFGPEPMTVACWKPERLILFLLKEGGEVRLTFHAKYFDGSVSQPVKKEPA